MTSNSGNFTINFTSFLLLLLAVVNTINAVQENELDSMLAVMRARGYSRFANAIATSDIHYEVISGTAFTFFAPINSSLFTLEMATTASDYVRTVRCHVVPRRLSLVDLRRLPSRSTVPTLLPGRDAVIERSKASVAIAVEGVKITEPGLFYGRDVAVHGLGGLISFRSTVGSRQRSSTMIHPPPYSTGILTSDHVPPPPALSSPMSEPSPNFTGNHTFGHLPPLPVIFDEKFEISIHTAVPEPANVNEFSSVRSHVSPLEISPVPEPSSFSELTSRNTYETLVAGEISYSSQSMINAQEEEYKPLDEQSTLDCLLADDKTVPVNHGGVSNGYLYTRQHYSVPSMTCRQTY